MKRVLVLVGAVVAGLSGCASPARYVEKSVGGDSGIVAIPANTDEWPNHYRQAAIAKIVEHVGPDYEIIEEKEVVTGQAIVNNQQTNTEKTANRANPQLGPGERQTVNNTTTTMDRTEYRIAYRKRVGGLPSQYGNIIQTRYPAPGPGAAPTVVPAGGIPTTPSSQPSGRVPSPTSMKLSTFDYGKDCKV